MIRKICLITLMLAGAVLIAGCENSIEEGISKARKTKGDVEVLRCYARTEIIDDTENKVKDPCWVKFPDEMTCLRSKGSDGYFSYSDCRGGFESQLQRPEVKIYDENTVEDEAQSPYE